MLPTKVHHTVQITSTIKNRQIEVIIPFALIAKFVTYDIKKVGCIMLIAPFLQFKQ